ncbi:MAG: hypothetical protein JWN70_4011 [Planctomycetaceae bacterium]|nr:hypothetical protein [Planctomycetaceae bacterium]
MPYVQRNWKGEITGLYANPQPQPDGTCLTEPAPLSEDHPEVQSYMAKHPIPANMLRPFSAEEMRKQDKMFERVAKEHEAIRNAVLAFNLGFAELETSLSCLLYAALNIRDSQIAYAIYHTPHGFDARTQIVGNAVIQIASEKKALFDLIEPWTVLAKKISKTRDLRNAIAHSAPLTYLMGNRNYARLSPPAFDVIRVGRKIAKGDKPGLDANDVNQGIKRLIEANDCVDHVNRLVTAFHEGDPSLPKKFDALKLALTKFRNP